MPDLPDLGVNFTMVNSKFEFLGKLKVKIEF